ARPDAQVADQAPTAAADVDAKRRVADLDGRAHRRAPSPTRDTTVPAFTGRSQRVVRSVTGSPHLQVNLRFDTPATTQEAPMTLHRTTRADLHCHSTASEHTKLGVQRALGLPECATPPEDVLELADRRGMDFVTITDHDTIAGVEQIADDPRVFISEELTAWFKGEPQAVHILCLGITRGDHEWLQAHSRDVEACAAYLHENGIACAL